MLADTVDRENGGKKGVEIHRGDTDYHHRAL